MKQVYQNAEITAFSGIRDAFNKPCYIVLNSALDELRIVAKNPEYKRRRKELDARGLQHVKVQEYLGVIDLKQKTADFIEKHFPGYKHTAFQIWN